MTISGRWWGGIVDVIWNGVGRDRHRHPGEGRGGDRNANAEDNNTPYTVGRGWAGRASSNPKSRGVSGTLSREEYTGIDSNKILVDLSCFFFNFITRPAGSDRIEPFWNVEHQCHEISLLKSRFRFPTQERAVLASDKKGTFHLCSISNAITTPHLTQSRVRLTTDTH